MIAIHAGREVIGLSAISIEHDVIDSIGIEDLICRFPKISKTKKKEKENNGQNVEP